MDNIDEIKELLQKDGIQITDDEIQTTITEFKYLIDIWLNAVERDLFEGKTLDELLLGGDDL